MSNFLFRAVMVFFLIFSFGKVYAEGFETTGKGSYGDRIVYPLQEPSHKMVSGDIVVNPYEDQNTTFFKRVNLSCGLAPLPPLGCRVGACVCDQYGQNCQWTFICN